MDSGCSSDSRRRVREREREREREAQRKRHVQLVVEPRFESWDPYATPKFFAPGVLFLLILVQFTVRLEYL